MGRNSAITQKQKMYILNMVRKVGGELHYDIDSLTKAQAGLIISNLEEKLKKTKKE